MELITSLKNGVCKITFNRPAVYNSFNKSMALELQKELDRCAHDDEVRTVLLTGAGKAFCAGQDLAEATDPNGPELESIVRDHYNPIILKIRALEISTVSKGTMVHFVKYVLIKITTSIMKKGSAKNAHQSTLFFYSCLSYSLWPL